MAEMNDKIVVAVRTRPQNSRERSMGAVNGACIVRMEGQQTSLLGNPKATGSDRAKAKEDRSFAYDHSFWSLNPKDKHFATQEYVYNCLGKGLLDNAFNGYNACIFAYGQTGSGKTYTMMGPPNDPGLIPRICNEMFARITQNNDPNVKYRVECSYMEIYNERVRDLLSMTDRKVNLKVREHKVLGPYVEGLRSFATEDFNAIEALIGEGLKSRVTASTAMNDESSRSHAVFNITLTESTYDEMTSNTGEKTSRVCLVDLAGSERVWRTGAEGDRLREGGSINKSLSTLGLVISHLADIAIGKKGKEAFIPYRDSVLTWLLKENLGGNSKTVMVATISPSRDSYEESLSTLRYADTAKRIQTFAVVNEDANARLIRDLREEVTRLRSALQGQGMSGLENISDSEMFELREKLQESERLMKEMSMSWEERLRIAHQVLEERARQLKDMGISVQQGGITVDQTKMYLLNLEPGQDELTMYYISDRAPSKIGSKNSQDIQIRGTGVLGEHCILPVEDGKLHIVPMPGADVVVNGEKTTKKTPLAHGAVLTLAGKEFRVSCPKVQSAGDHKQVAEPEPDEGLPSSHSWPGSKFHRACENGDMPTVVYLLGNKFDPNSEDARWKRAPLMLAADHGHMDVCKLLLENGAVAGKADERGYTPLHACADSGHIDICKVLIENGADADPKAQIGCTPLHRAAEQGHIEVVKYLQQNGADVNFQDRGKGWTPILLGTLHGRLDVCKFLLGCGASVKTLNRYGESCLHMAAQPGHLELVKLMLENGADATLQQAYGRTAFDYAAETTSFIMLHSPLERLKRREEVCRVLYPHLNREQRRSRSLTERKSIIIAQVHELSDPFKCRMMDYNTPQSGAAGRPTSTKKASATRTTPSSRAGSATARAGSVSRRPVSASRVGSTASTRKAATGPKRNPPSVATDPKRPSARKTTVPKGPTLSSGSRARSASASATR
jgi:ankyrin repeat protein